MNNKIHLLMLQKNAVVYELNNKQFNRRVTLLSRMHRLATWITPVTMKTDHCTRTSINVVKLPVQGNIIQNTQQQHLPLFFYYRVGRY
jgi:hypothetical protein